MGLRLPDRGAVSLPSGSGGVRSVSGSCELALSKKVLEKPRYEASADPVSNRDEDEERRTNQQDSYALWYRRIQDRADIPGSQGEDGKDD
jgi:hypothetical protein